MSRSNAPKSAAGSRQSTNVASTPRCANKGSSNCSLSAPSRSPLHVISATRLMPRRAPRLGSAGSSQSLLLHFLAQTQWPHVRPDLLDIGQAHLLCSALAGVLPAQRVFAVRRPEGILFFVVDHNLINCLIFCVFRHGCLHSSADFISNHGSKSYTLRSCASEIGGMYVPTTRRSHHAPVSFRSRQVV